MFDIWFADDSVPYLINLAVFTGITRPAEYYIFHISLMEIKFVLYRIRYWPILIRTMA